MVDFEKLTKRIKICEKCKHEPYKQPDIRMDKMCRTCSVFTENINHDNKFEESSEVQK